jgi:hypothetical protein
MSKIDDEVWIAFLDNTNVAKTAHVLSNHRKKSLKLVIAIIQYVIYIYIFIIINFIF